MITAMTTPIIAAVDIIELGLSEVEEEEGSNVGFNVLTKSGQIPRYWLIFFVALV